MDEPSVDNASGQNAKDDLEGRFSSLYRMVSAYAVLLRDKLFDVALTTDDDVVHGRLLPSGWDAAIFLYWGEVFLWICGEPADDGHPIHDFVEERREAILREVSHLTSDPILLTGRWVDFDGADDGYFAPFVVTIFCQDGPRGTLIAEGTFDWERQGGFHTVSHRIEESARQDVIIPLPAAGRGMIEAANDALYEGEWIDGILWQVNTGSKGRAIVSTKAG
ncbi:hypothetical protein [Ciceribacter sp. L1K22]|uniref:hypothetical protein n=1 Tax=Ciceribacter sp. L1K22 TaxID=2820275 RepID=UPI001ABE5551|nr:hypothetical protein [Ciceribacter sp. L1K22]MBO3761359.1 hypothetical protein [Ciceribacter sp. L1K22]